METGKEQRLDLVFGRVHASGGSSVFVEKGQIKEGLVNLFPFVAIQAQLLLLLDAKAFGMCKMVGD